MLSLRLLPHLPFETHIRLDHELCSGTLQFVSEFVPLRHRQHGAKMTNRNIVTINGTGCAMTDFVRRQMSNDLVPVKIEINPFG